MAQHVPSDMDMRDTLESVLGQARASEDALALIGGGGLRAHHVPWSTLDLDFAVQGDASDVMRLARALVANGWKAIVYEADGDARVVRAPVLHTVDTEHGAAILEMVPLRSPFRVPVELIVAHHPLEVAGVERAAYARVYDTPRVPVAPLDTILGMKARANRDKDRYALSAAAEHLPAATMEAAIRRVDRYDQSLGDELAAILAEVRATKPRPNPARTPRAARARR